MYKLIRRFLAMPYYVFFFIVNNSRKKIIAKWFFLDGDNAFLLNHKLNKDSIVFEVGGYKGIFSKNIVNMYSCSLYVFEPIEEFANMIESQFSKDDKVKVFKYGLGAENKSEKISMLDDSSSVYLKTGAEKTIMIKDIHDFFKENPSISEIDLMQINIEGGEYPLLKRMIELNYINKVKTLQIQFHDFVDDSSSMRDSIINSLLKTHERTFSFPFLWEGFTKKKE